MSLLYCFLLLLSLLRREVSTGVYIGGAHCQKRVDKILPLGGVGGGLQEHEVDGGDEAGEGCSVVPVELLALEEDSGNDGEDNKGDDFLDDLQLHE